MKMTVVLLVVLGIAAAICAVVLVNILDVVGGRSKDLIEVPVVQAATGLSKGKRLTSEDVKLGTAMKNELPPTGTFSNLALVVGRTLAVDVAEGEVIAAHKLETGGSIAELISRLPPGMRAVSVTLSKQQVTGGLLYPGCVVDVLVAFSLTRGFASEGKGEAVSTTLLEKIEVLAIQGEMAGESANPDEEGKKTPRESGRTLTVTLMLNTKQAEALQLAAENGSISLAMRNPLDDLAVDEDPTVLNRGKLTKRGMLIDPIVKANEGMNPSSSAGSTSGSSDKSNNWGVTVIRGPRVDEEEIKVPE